MTYKILPLFFSILFPFTLIAQNVALNEDGSAPDTIVLLHLKSQSQLEGIKIENLSASTETMDQSIGVNTILNSSGSQELVAFRSFLFGGSASAYYGQKNEFIGSSLSGNKYGSFNSFLGGGGGDTYGNYNVMSSGSDGDIYSFYSNIINFGNGTKYGNYITMPNIGSGKKYGSFIDMGTIGSDDIYGNSIRINAIGDGPEVYGNELEIEGSGMAMCYGNFLDMNHNGDAVHYASYDSLSGSGAGDHFGSYHILTGIGSGNQYSNFNSIKNSSDGIHFANFNEILNDGNGNHIGSLYNLEGEGNGDHYGILTTIFGDGNGVKAGIFNAINSNGLGTKYGIFNDLTADNSNDADMYGSYQKIEDDGLGVIAGNFNDITSSELAECSGTNNKLQGIGDGAQYGSKSEISNTGDGDHFGTFNEINGNSDGHHYGSYNVISSTGAGMHVAGYFKANGGTQNMAALFDEGNVVVNFSEGDSDFRVASSQASNLIRTDGAQHRIGLGTGNPSEFLHIKESKSNGPFALVENADTSSTSDALAIRIGGSILASTNRFIVFQDGGGNAVGGISGNVTGGVTYGSLSDRRLKQNIRPFENGLDLVKKIGVHEYELKTHPKEKQIGFVAQELFKVFPQVVSGTPESPIETPMTVDYGKVTPILVKAIQELEIENAELKQKNLNLEKRLEKIESLLQSSLSLNTTPKRG